MTTGQDLHKPITKQNKSFQQFLDRMTFQQLMEYIDRCAECQRMAIDTAKARIEYTKNIVKGIQ